MKASTVRLTTAICVGFLLLQGCHRSVPPPPQESPATIRQHSDASFQRLHQVESGIQESEPVAAGQPPSEAASKPSFPQVPAGEIRQTGNETISATGYGNLSRGLTVCQHTADLAARVELSKLIRVQVKERSVDRVRERTGKELDQDIEVVREGVVNEVLTDVMITNRSIDRAMGTCSSTAIMPKHNLLRAITGDSSTTTTIK